MHHLPEQIGALQQEADQVLGRIELALPHAPENVFHRMREVLDLHEAEEAGAPLDRVHGAEHLVEELVLHLILSLLDEEKVVLDSLEMLPRLLEKDLKGFIVEIRCHGLFFSPFTA